MCIVEKSRKRKQERNRERKMICAYSQNKDGNKKAMNE